MFIRSWFSGCFVNREGMFSSLLIAYSECSSVFKVLRRGRGFRFPLTTGSGYHGFSGLSFNPWFDSFFPVEAGRGFRFPASTRKALAENAFRGPCEAIESIACLRPVPLLSKRAHSIASPGSSQMMFALVSRFPRFAPPAVAGVP